MEKQRILITNIQRFSLHDGPGIRTTVFLKGCNLRCPWCCNPENIENKIQAYTHYDIKGEYGKWIDAKSLYDELIKDRSFYFGKVNVKNYHITDNQMLESLPGGVTFSGGEPLLQMKQLHSVCDRLRNNNIHIAMETSLFATRRLVELAIEFVDLLYIDIKILDEIICRKVLKGDLHLFFDNIDLVMKSQNPVVFRVPLIYGYTYNKENCSLIGDFLSKVSGNVIKIELLKGHNLGLQKYRSMVNAGNDLLIRNMPIMDDLQIIQYMNDLKTITKIPIEICSI